MKLVFLVLAAVLFTCCSDIFKGNTELAEIAKPYKNFTVIDIHNHDASGYTYKKSLDVWESFGIDKVVLFGDISEPSAQETDAIAFKAYKKYPDQIIPFIAGINIFDSSCLEYIRSNFDKGVCGIGEVVGASIYSPVTSKLPWKGNDPLDGYFPEIYELCAAYGKPVLLHLDPANGAPVEKLKEAATLYPNTSFIFGHANAYNSPANLRVLLEDYDNIYIDFYAGFTEYNAESANELADFVPLINEFPDQFMVSTDGGYGIGYDKAYTAIYELFNLLDSEVVVKIAGQNFLRVAGLEDQGTK
jgi:predicted TIM-barrel fold metal-dependent hydrolase